MPPLRNDIGPSEVRPSHSVHSVADCVIEHADNAEFTISLLDRSFLTGDAALFQVEHSEREPELVQRDVIEGKVSAQAARDDYGVVINDDAVDGDATTTLRHAIKTKRDRTPAMIDRGPGYDLMLSGKAPPRMKAGV